VVDCNAMENCCNTVETQSSYREMVDKVATLCAGVMEFVRNMEIDWTETILGTLFVAHITFLLLFFCSRSLIAATFRE